MQYKNRKSATKAFNKYSSLRCEREEHEEFSPGEIFLLRLLISDQKKKRRARNHVEGGVWSDSFNRWTPENQRHYNKMKSIARGFGIFPISEETRKYMEVRERMANKKHSAKDGSVGLIVHYTISGVAE